MESDSFWFDEEPDLTYSEHGICPDCESSGEGHHDGSNCKTCRGLGEILGNKQ